MINDGNGHYIFGTVTVGERGQIVIPKEARDIFNIKPGDTLFVLGDKDKGIAIPCSKKDISNLYNVISGE